MDLFQSAAPKPNTDLPLPPVEPSLQLASNGSPRPGLTAAAAAAAPRNKSPTPDQRASPNPSHQASGNPSGKPSSKQAANPSSPDPAAVTQTATPPPTARKDRRKPPKKLRMNHHGPQEFGQPDFTGASHQEFAGLMASPNELFSYPMSAPVSAPENFWDPSTMTLPMDMDFGADMFQPQHHHEPTGHGHHRQSSSFDWNNMFQEVAPQHTQPQQPQQLQQQQQPASMNHNANANQAKAPRRARALAPKPAAAPLQSSMSVNSLPVDNSFGIMGHHSNAGAVDPGILFSRPQTAAADSSFKAMIDDGSAEAALAGSAKAGMTGMPNGLRRSASARDTRMAGGNFPDRSFDTSPLKQGPSRPGLPRSQSDVRGRRPVSRPAMTTKNAVPSLDLSRVHTAPPATVSPLKKQQHRLSSLASIPESIPRPSSRASVKFYIGADGRAHAEAAEQPNLPPQAGPSVPAAKKNRSPSRSSVEINQWDEDYDSSSSDDEPIVIPSRTNSFTSLPSHSHSSSASFALPDPRRPVGSIFHPPSSKRGTVGPSDLHNNMLPRDMLRDGGDMSDDAETVMNDVQNDDGADAVSELLRVKENRQQAGGGSSKSQRFFSSSASAMYARGGYSNSVSPTRPGTANTMDGSVRCVCGRNDVPGFLVQW